MAPLPAHENGSEESKPLISVDIHAEAGADRYKKRRMTVLDHESEKWKVIFNKTIAGRYKRDGSEYEEVGVLLITWEKDELLCRKKEVPRLSDIFSKRFGYKVEEYRIPSSQSATGLQFAVANFAHRYDSPDKLAIVYYAGHGDVLENRLGIYEKREGDGEGDPSTFFDDALQQLKHPDTDILTILDCCYAARAFSQRTIGKRKFELLAATPASEPARGPEHVKSFTGALCDSLEGLLDETLTGFTTSRLYQQIYFRQEDERKPMLFDQSAFDYGKIWLRPIKKANGHMQLAVAKKGRREPVAYVDLQLKLSKEPTPLMMNQLALAMQYLPHVKDMKFEHLHAPHKDLEGFMVGVRQAMLLRPLIAKLRLRRTLKKLRELSEAGQLEERRKRARSHLVMIDRRDSSVYDWSKSELHDDRTRTHVAPPRRSDSPLSMHEGEHDLDHPSHDDALDHAKKHHVGPWLSYAYSIDASGLKALFRPAPDQSFCRRPHTTAQDVLVMSALVLLGALLWYCLWTFLGD